MAYQIFSDSSCDLSKKIREELNIDYYRMGIVVKGEDKYADINYEDYTPEELYGWISDLSNHCKTSLASIKEFIDKSEPYLKEGKDILYIACTDALTGTRGVFELVKKELLEKYPDRKMISINSCRAELALGMIVIKAAKMQKEGKSMEEVIEWIENNKQNFHQCGSLETLTYLKAAGRVSGAAAFFGNMINLKPIIMFDVHGHNYVFKKVRGSKKALNETFEYIKENMIPGVTDVIYVGQAMAKDKQAYLKERITKELGIRVEEFWIGPIVGISCGPGMYGCWFEGKKVTADSEKK